MDCQGVIGKVTKDPAAVLDYSLDWGEWLEPDDVIASSAWTITPMDGVSNSLAIEDMPFTTDVTTVWLSGGEPCAGYIVTNHVVTSGGREDDRSLLVSVVER